MPSNAELAEQFELLADMLELDGADAFRLTAYRRAASRIRESAVPVAQLAQEGNATRLSGIGTTIQNKILEYAETGDLSAIAKLREKLPSGLVEVMHLPGLGPKTAKKLYVELGVKSAGDLQAAAEQGLLAGLPGLGPKTEEKILKELAKPKKAIERKPLLGKVLPAVERAVAELHEHPAAEQVSEAGSVRRRCETVKDLDIIATASDPAALTAHFVARPWVAEVVAHGSTKATVVSHDGLRFDLRVVPPESYGNLLQHFTGSKAHNVALREAAVRAGFSVSEYGVQDVERGKLFRTREEAELYEHLGYAFIPPELRENAGELDAARDGTLPELVELGDLRGDLHSHSTWSADARSSIEEMGLAARDRGYDYLALTDHSHYLREGRLRAQWKEIAAVNERLAPFRVLRGIEVNIRANGSLDVSDEDLAECDWVIASLHTAFDRDPTGRVLVAMENPHVDCIGHLTARKINRRLPADVDLDRVIEKALETRTFLEVNSQPDRLDLRDAHARAVGEAGVLVAVSTDSHSVAALSFVELGIGQARRGWLTKQQVLNTRPWREIEKLCKRK